MNEKTEPTCPICDKSVDSLKTNKAFPFCSKRCKQRDLGSWLSGDYAVAGPPAAAHDIAEELRRKGD